MNCATRKRRKKDTLCLAGDRSTFPEIETLNGHLASCLSVNLKTLNDIAEIVAKSAPRFTSIHVPKAMGAMVKSWPFLPKISDEHAANG